MNPQAKAAGLRQAAHVLVLAALCSFLVIFCSGVSHARSLGTVTEPTGTGYPRVSSLDTCALALSSMAMATTSPTTPRLMGGAISAS